MEQTFVMVKPDGVQRNLVGRIIHKFEQKGYKLTALKLLQPSGEQAEEHYKEHKGKPFYRGLVAYIMSGPVVAMVWEGKDVVRGVRSLIGATNPAEALPGTIRGDYGLDIGRNIVHGADSEDNARREISIYFRKEEICKYNKGEEDWVYEEKSI